MIVGQLFWQEDAEKSHSVLWLEANVAAAARLSVCMIEAIVVVRDAKQDSYCILLADWAFELTAS